MPPGGVMTDLLIVMLFGLIEVNVGLVVLSIVRHRPS